MGRSHLLHRHASRCRTHSQHRAARRLLFSGCSGDVWRHLRSGLRCMRECAARDDMRMVGGTPHHIVASHRGSLIVPAADLVMCGSGSGVLTRRRAPRALLLAPTRARLADRRVVGASRTMHATHRKHDAINTRTAEFAQATRHADGPESPPHSIAREGRPCQAPVLTMAAPLVSLCLLRCPSSGRCLLGSSSGPSSLTPSVTCPTTSQAGSWAYNTTQCTAPNDLCTQWASCAQCSNAPYTDHCGWSGTCVAAAAPMHCGNTPQRWL